MGKHKKKRIPEKEKFLFIHMTDDDILYYSPEFCSSREEAFAKVKEDISYIATKEGFKWEQVFRPQLKDIYRRIGEKWED